MCLTSVLSCSFYSQMLAWATQSCAEKFGRWRGGAGVEEIGGLGEASAGFQEVR